MCRKSVTKKRQFRVLFGHFRKATRKPIKSGYKKGASDVDQTDISLHPINQLAPLA